MVSTFAIAQEEEDAAEAAEDTEDVLIFDDADSTKVKKVIKGKRIKLIIATKENGEDATEEIVIELPESISDADAESIEEALEEASEALEEAMEEAGEAMEEALERAAEELAEAQEREGDARERVDEHRVIIKDGDHVVIPGIYEEEKTRKKPKLVETSWNVLELGINAMITPDGSDLPAPYSDMDIIPGKSINFHWGIVQQGINIGGGKLRLVYGLGIDYNNYRFKEDIDIAEGSDPLTYTVNTDVDYKKNKLVAQYLTMPLMLNFKSNPKNDSKSFKLAAGIHGGYLIQSHQKQKWEENGSKEKKKIRGDYNFNPYRLGYALQFGYGDVNMFAKYYPDPTFRDGKGPDVNTVAVGIVIMPF